MTTAYQKMFRCGECDQLHEYEDDAESCCAPKVEQVFVCDDCDAEMKTEDMAKAHVCGLVDPPEWVEDRICLCGARLIAEDYRPSMLLGTQIRCERCREKLLEGKTAPQAVIESFTERGLAQR